MIGRADRLPTHSYRVLTELNKSLHRVEVVPYDVLARRADAVLANVERYVLVLSAEVGDELVDDDQLADATLEDLASPETDDP